MPKTPKYVRADFKDAPEGEHIFPATAITKLALRWKELNAAGRDREAMLVLEDVIRGMTPMLERFAQHEGFHHTVDLDRLVAAAQSKIVKWLLAWKPKQGKIFSWASKSFAANTLVILEDGTAKRIDEIVENKLPLKVISWNRSTDQFEPKPIINWIKDKADFDQWRKLSVKWPGIQEGNKKDGGTKRLIMTVDHEVYTDRGLVRIGELTDQDSLIISRPTITPDGMSALIGMYLGDGTIGKKGYFVVGHGGVQEEYTKHVARLFGRDENIYHGESTLTWTQRATGDLITKTYPVNNVRILHKRLWRNCPLTPVKAITEWLLDNINPVVLAYWYMDDGHLQFHHNKKDKNGLKNAHYIPGFCCESFTLEDCHRIQERMLVEWGVDTWSCEEKSKNPDKPRHGFGRIYVRKGSIGRFFELVAPHMIPLFDYKIPPEYRNTPKKHIEFVRREKVYTKDFSVKPIGALRKNEGFLDYKYDITVADNHNILISSNNHTTGKFDPSARPAVTQKGTMRGLVVAQCAKNSFRSEVIKEATYRSRFHVTSDNLEKYHGTEDHAVDKGEREAALAAVKTQIRGMTSRWGDPQELGAIRYIIECVLEIEDSEGSSLQRQKIIRGAAFANCISLDLAKFFYNWVLVEMRHQLYHRARTPFTEQDLFRHVHSYSHLADLLDLIGWELMKKVIVVLGGQRLKIPTVAQMIKMVENHQLYTEVEESDQDPGTVETIAKKHRRSGKSAQEVYEEMQEAVHPNRSGEHFVFDQEESFQ